MKPTRMKSEFVSLNLIMLLTLSACSGSDDDSGGPVIIEDEAGFAAFIMTDMKDGKALISGDLIQNDTRLFHQEYQERKTAQWRWEYVLTEEGQDYFHIYNRAFNKALVADVLTITLPLPPFTNTEVCCAIYHQDPSQASNTLWRREEVSEGVYRIINKEYGKAIVAGRDPRADLFAVGEIYLDDANDRENAKWRFNEVDFEDQAAEYSGTSFYITDAKHNLDLIAGQVYNGDVYHMTGDGRLNAQWQIKPQPSTENCPGDFGTWNHIIDRKHGRALVAGDSNDNNLFHQDAMGRDNALWQLVSLDDGTYHIMDCKHGEALVAGNNYDAQTYHQPPDGRPNAQWRINKVLELDLFTKEQHVAKGFTKTPEALIELLDAYSPHWHFYDGPKGEEHLYPVDVEKHLTTDVNPESPNKWRACDTEGDYVGTFRLYYAPTADLEGDLWTAKNVGIAEQIVGGYNLTYYLYYPYNIANPILDNWDHYGDWERATITLQWRQEGDVKFLEPTILTTEAHGNIWRSPWGTENEVWIHKGSHTNELGHTIYYPEVFVAHNSHGTYPNTKHERTGIPGENDSNRTCTDYNLAVFCDYVSVNGYFTRLPNYPLEAISDRSGLIKFVHLETGETPVWLSKPNTCDPTEQGPYPADGPINRWGGTTFSIGDLNFTQANGPSGPLEKKVWGWYNFPFPR